MRLKDFIHSVIGSTVCNILLAYAVFMVARIVFFTVNYSVFSGYMSWTLAGDIMRGAFAFDTTAVIYVNALYILMALLPLHLKENAAYYRATRIVYVSLNALALLANLADTIYFPYTGRRTTATVFSEFSNEHNLLTIVGHELLIHWYLVIIFIAIIYAMWKLYSLPHSRYRMSYLPYYAVMTLSLAAAVPLSIAGIRGGMGKAVRPITISNANQYVNRPVEAAIVLNTPFSIIRTIGKKAFVDPAYMSNRQMLALYSPIHQPADSTRFRHKNVVVIIIESFGKEYSTFFNRDLDGGKYKGYMPFLDSLASKSLTFQHSFANGHKSIDGMPSILSGIPMFVEPFFLTPASLNKVSSIAGELKSKGYYTAFFHGAPNGSMGFEAFARAVGFKDYYGMTEYKSDHNRMRDGDYDGTWAIWDEPFLQFYADKMSTFRQPFMTSVFTASSHHPYAIPDRYKAQFPEGKLPINKCVAYTDMALRQFFANAKRQPWYKNTLFVITADHTNQTARPEYETSVGNYSVPIIFYAPGDSGLVAFRHNGVAQQTDIMPTTLGYLGYDRPFLSFGNNLLATPAAETFAVNYYNGLYQYIKGDFVLLFDGKEVKGVYNYRTDRLMRNNLIGKSPKTQHDMEMELKAIIQQYMQRMNADRLTVK